MIGKYESMIILSPNLQNEDLEKENKKIHNLITQLGGEVLKTDIMGKKPLAYEIAKFKEGYFLINYFKLDTQKIHESDRHYRLSEVIIRSNIIKLEHFEQENE
jgi:small subunit ribosomal protein S6